ncbi:TonB-dependent receptor domain-containing protein [Litoribrevibacter albus]|uniref:TonB-dependent receptor n=1 Tax=Litoribrevibacter albus TaxID=1473156 RepID=A0AA37S9H6_9GAMM|nr:TonB-dependent receptor [Litoribrevibacter albus]GLQ31575.1 TonB-dependent receptor [Litoribrevibacter albus]
MIFKSRLSQVLVSKTFVSSTNKSPAIASMFAAAMLMHPNVHGQSIENSQPNTMVVTANRTAVSVDETLSSVTIITREDIERSQARSTEELLRDFANVTIKNTGGRGKQSSLFLRGTASTHTLFLIDGVKVGSANNGATAFQNIPVDQIERIEVVKGPRSSLYGSEAAGGVIQIFTRKQSQSGFSPFIRVGAGSDDTQEVALGFGVRNDSASLNATYSYEGTDGIDAYKHYESDDDAFENSSLTVNSDIKLSGKTNLTFNYLQSHTQNEFDDSFGFYPNQQNKDTLRVLGFGLNNDMTQWWSSSIQLGRSWEKSHTFANFKRLSSFETRRDSFSWINEFTPSDDVSVVVGYDFQDDHSDTTSNFIQNERNNHGVFTQVQMHVSGHDLELNHRYDDNEQFGSEHTGSLGWGYSFENETRLKASYGTAFVAPSFNYLYHPGFGFCCSGNPDLKPEKSDTLELGINGVLESVNWSITWFRTRIQDLIVSEEPFYIPENVNQARIQGMEFSANTRFFDWVIRGDLSLLSAKSRNGVYKGNRLINRPTQTLSIMMDRDFGRFSAGASFVAENESYVDQANTVELPGYATVDLRVGYEVIDGLKWQAKIENLFEKEYEVSRGYNQPELTYLVSVTYQP